MYGFCLYCARGEDNARELAVKCDCIHLRNAEIIEEDINNSIGLGINKEEIDYDNMLDANIQRFKEIKQWEIAVLNTNIAKEIETYKNDFLNYHVTAVVDGSKYQCGICRKLFVGKEYVITHINNKHSEIMNEMINNVYHNEKQKEIYYEYKHKFSDNDEAEIITTLDEYNALLQSKNNKRNNNRDGATTTMTTTKARYVDYDSISNRKKHEIRILTYEEL